MQLGHRTQTRSARSRETTRARKNDPPAFMDFYGRTPLCMGVRKPKAAETSAIHVVAPKTATTLWQSNYPNTPIALRQHRDALSLRHSSDEQPARRGNQRARSSVYPCSGRNMDMHRRIRAGRKVCPGDSDPMVLRVRHRDNGNRTRAASIDAEARIGAKKSARPRNAGTGRFRLSERCG